MRIYPVCAVLILTATIQRPSSAQRVALDSVATADTALRHDVRLRDGSALLGRIVAVTSDSVQVQLTSGMVSVARNAVTSVRQFSATRMHRGEYWFENPHPTRLLFSPTAFSLGAFEGYYSNIWLFFNSVAIGLTDRFSIGAGMTVLPTNDIRQNLYYLTPKLTLIETPRAAFALGGFLGVFPALADENESGSLGILYGVTSAGDRDSNVSLGLGWGYLGGQLADRPVVMAGFQGRALRNVAFISENWFLPGDEINSVISYGLRLMGERISADLALLQVLEETRFPGLPFVGVAVKF